MAVGRKTDVSTKSGWFGRDSKQSSRSRRSAKASANLHRPKPAKNVTKVESRLPTVTGHKISKPQSSQKQGRSLQNSVSSSDKESNSTSTSKRRIPVVPTSLDAPSWLLRLHTIQRYSSVTTFSLVIVALMLYGWAVYSQQLWTQGYKTLQNLQRDERQLTAANEVIKNKMAQEAEQPSNGLILPTPTGTIFLRSAPIPPNPVQLTPTPTPQEQQSINPKGGY